MQKKIANFLFSTRLTGVLFIVFAVAMAVGTLLDRNMDTSPTPFTRTYIYNAWWFEAIMAVFVINFVGNIFRYRLLRKEKWATLILHLSFIFILLGAFITRYVGYEGMMAIREGQTENTFLSTETFIHGRIVGDHQINGQTVQRNFEEKVDFSERLDNDFEETIDYGETPVTFRVKEFIRGAEKDIIPSDTGESYLKIVEAGEGRPHNHFLKDGEVQSLHNILISLNKEVDGAINITNTEDGIFIKSPYEGEYLTMATRAKGTLVKDSLQRLALRSRYIIANLTMVFPKPVVKGEFGVVKKSNILKNDEDGIILEVSANGESKDVNLVGGKGTFNLPEDVNVGGLDITVNYGAKLLEIPFSIKLNDFIAERQPGTERVYKAYESKVTVVDEEQGDFDYRIYMNNILDHRGYRFFQSSFEPDELTTILSVNHDKWGTLITYAGYFLLYFGLMAILFARHTRFDDLRKMLEKIKTKKSKLVTGLFLVLGLSGFAQHTPNDGHGLSDLPSQEQLDSILRANIAPKEHADKFGKVVIQDISGRMMPMNTFASEVLRKLSKSDTYEDLDANQVLLSMQESPQLWYNMPIIYLKLKKGDSIRTLIGVDKDVKYTKFSDYFTSLGEYKLSPYLESAYKAQIPNGFQKEIKETDQRVTLLYNVVEGQAMRIFPVPGDENNKWISSDDFRRDGYREQISDSLYGNFINNGFSAYLITLNEAKKTGDFTTANTMLNGFKNIQEKYGSEVMLSDEKIETEILYNKYDIFKRLFSWYMYAGTLLFVLLIVQIFKYRSRGLKITINVFVGIIIFLFVLHTAGLIARWYIAGHAPWSDAYESMIYVAWATMLFGFIIGMSKNDSKIHKNDYAGIVLSFLRKRKNSNLTIASGAFVTSMILMIAHWNWMDPAIANLQPVLDSYWLMIHVAVIVASYGPFTLSMILGAVSLLLMIMTTSKNKDHISLSLKELTVINEMSMTVGLVMLTIGNFLGGMWANESWGRYWGWDPKETWALISIMVYAFVIHMRLIPGLRSRWFFNLMAIVAFGSILMTYFGVNFYLSGLHSYASGDQIISFQFIGIACVLVALLGFFAYRKYKRYY
ncbi:cytochrome c biogenesis protein CcsA [Winogradskyella maritima]|uniref:Cytochrome c biogenesis protein CcsA n=1 Tax=Winogradskyella maritima TaxID=1517766 RepID=A0ABV8AC36_9FLAO|nr:cytochrome c biogenesis protein CcsA [Winogradskyella maritima]